jgi:hypothetical protein
MYVLYDGTLTRVFPTLGLAKALGAGGEVAHIGFVAAGLWFPTGWCLVGDSSYKKVRLASSDEFKEFLGIKSAYVYFKVFCREGQTP